MSEDGAARRPVANLLGLAVLSYLTAGPMHPYELGRLLRDRDAAHTFKLSHGALYSVIRQLLREGFVVEAGSGRTGNRPQYTVYQLTDAGRQEMRLWLRELLATPRHEYPAFAAALSLVAVLPSGEVTELLRTRAAHLREEREAIARQRDDVVGSGVLPIFLVEDDYRIALLDAEREFIATLIERITDPVTGWASAWAAHLDASEGRET